MNSTTEWVGFIRFVAATSSSNDVNWIYAAFCSALVGLTGLVPILLFPNTEDNNNDKKQDNNVLEPPKLRFLLSFAVGGLLGDVFLHLLPEALTQVKSHEDFNIVGLCILAGLLVFTIVEKIMQSTPIGTQSTGYLNLAANCIDNFNHGLAVGGAFLISRKVGLVTTGCILLHEIPHEVGDFAILIKSGFNRREAAKAQFTTAFVGIIGALAALLLDTLDCLTFFIVPFTCGGFLHISMVAVLPDLLESQNIKDCAKVMMGIVSGVGTMWIASSF